MTSTQNGVFFSKFNYKKGWTDSHWWVITEDKNPIETHPSVGRWRNLVPLSWTKVTEIQETVETFAVQYGKEIQGTKYVTLFNHQEPPCLCSSWASQGASIQVTRTSAAGHAWFYQQTTETHKKNILSRSAKNERIIGMAGLSVCPSEYSISEITRWISTQFDNSSPTKYLLNELNYGSYQSSKVLKFLFCMNDIFSFLKNKRFIVPSVQQRLSAWNF
jgi:hypothetical protein